MTECPSCRTAHERQPKFCDNCGYRFGAVSTPVAGDARTSPGLKKCPDCAEEVRNEARKCRFCGFEFEARAETSVEIVEMQAQEQPSQAQEQPSDVSYQVNRPLGRVTPIKVLSALAIVAVVAYLKSGEHFASPSPSEGGNPDVTLRPAPAIPGRAGIGETTVVRKGNGFWPCGSTEEAFDELMKWAVRGDNAEVKRTMRTSSSLALDGGMNVKILGISFGRRKVRVLTNSAGETYLKDEHGVFSADPRIGRECWVVSEALTR